MGWKSSARWIKSTSEAIISIGPPGPILMINKHMKILEILLPKGTDDKSLSAHKIQQIGMLQKRMNRYVDKICDPKTSPQGREFLKSRLRDDYMDLKDALSQGLHKIAEAVHKLPLTPDDFELVKKLMEKPIPAIIAPIYISEVIEDDAFTDELNSLAETDPGRDVRQLIVDWIDRVMPDQKHRFGQEVGDMDQKKGMFSVLHGYDPHYYKGGGD